MNAGEYANDSFIDKRTVRRPVQKARIKQLVQQAEKLEEAELAPNPNNVDMLYAAALPRQSRSTPLSSSAPGFPRCAMPWERVAITNAFSNSIRTIPTPSWSSEPTTM